jgi:hypothetical protein
MNSFMPSNLTSALYNQVSQGNRGSEYSYDINLTAVNKSLNEYNIGSVVSNGNQNPSDGISTAAGPQKLH